MEEYHSGEIINSERDETVIYSIVIDESHQLANSMQATWGPFFFGIISGLIAKCESQEELSEAISERQLQDFHWKWPEIVSQEAEGYTRTTFYLIAEGTVEGALHAYAPKQSLVEKGLNLVYVDFVAVAPWNRPKAVGYKRYGGVGTKLIRSLLQYSHSQGYAGCIALHSLPQAEDYYRALGMDEYGKDVNYHNLRYFEMDGSVASEHLERVS